MHKDMKFIYNKAEKMGFSINLVPFFSIKTHDCFFAYEPNHVFLGGDRVNISDVFFQRQIYGFDSSVTEKTPWFVGKQPAVGSDVQRSLK